jgi:hypothetical protein
MSHLMYTCNSFRGCFKSLFVSCLDTCYIHAHPRTLTHAHKQHTSLSPYVYIQQIYIIYVCAYISILAPLTLCVHRTNFSSCFKSHFLSSLYMSVLLLASQAFTPAPRGISVRTLASEASRIRRTRSVCPCVGRACVCLCVCVCVYIYIYIYIYTHTHTHVYMSDEADKVHLSVCVYVCACVHIKHKYILKYTDTCIHI